MNAGAVSNSYSYNLQTRRTIGLKPECHDLIDNIDLIEDSETRVDKTYHRTRTLMYIFLSILFFFGVLSLISFITKRDLFWKARSLLTIVTLLVFVSLMAYWLVRANIATGSLTDFEDQDCSDPFTDQALKPVINIYNSDYLTAAWWALFLGAAALIAYGIIAYVQNNKSEQLLENNSGYLAMHKEEIYGQLDTKYTNKGPSDMNIRKEPGLYSGRPNIELS